MRKYIGLPILIYLFIFFCVQKCHTPKQSFKEAKANRLIQVYIDSFKDAAINEMLRTGIPASVKLAQGVLESQYGQSELARKASNHFGIKCGKNWDGLRYSVMSNEWEPNKKRMIPRLGCFRVYEDAAACYRAHSDFLKNGTRYQTLFALAPTDYRGWANGLQDAGYATDPGYADKLISLIERFQLYKHDMAFMTPEVPSLVQ